MFMKYNLFTIPVPKIQIPAPFKGKKVVLFIYEKTNDNNQCMRHSSHKQAKILTFRWRSGEKFNTDHG